ncbi:hypothetical protein FQR65_LT04509 [Abscondita terminalis]|nr:hypothetical protein FQR65_LT04509 [Abscondita terminalis]
MQYPEIRDLDCLFGFNEAQRKAGADATNQSHNQLGFEPDFIPHRVFINNVDSFNGKYIVSFLSQQIHGAKRLSVSGEGEEEMCEEGDEFVAGEDVESEMIKPQQPVGKKYEVIGSVYKTRSGVPEETLFVTNEEDENFMTNIMKCGFVVYDISQNPNEIVKALATIREIYNKIETMKEQSKNKKPEESRVFILISTVMTWAFTKPIDPDDPTLPFTEADYKKRKPHPNFKEHINCEREITMLGRKDKGRLKTYIICSGIVYGMEEEDLTFFFKLAWTNEKELPIFKQGKNVVPLIHVKDLAKVVFAVIDKTPTKPQVIVAVEQTPCNFKEVIKSLSKIMGSSRTKNVDLEEAFLYNDMTQNLYDRYTLNLNMEPASILDRLEIEWTSDLNFAENIKNVVREFKQSRGFAPLRVIMHGPPAVGKTRIAKQLASYYKAHYLNIKVLIEETVEELREARENAKLRIKEGKETKEEESTKTEEEGEEEEEEVVDIEEITEKLRYIEIALEENEKLPDEQVIELLKDYLKSNIAQNQGYILDGYPKTMEQVKDLYENFEKNADEGDEELEEEEDEALNPLLPDYVVSLEATDEFLCERVMRLSEKEILGTHYGEESMLRRLAEFRLNNTDDNTPLDFFNELEIHPIVLNVMEDKTENLDSIMEILKKRFGNPKGFDLSIDDEEELKRLNEAKQKLLEAEAAMKRELLEKEAVAKHQIKMEQWAAILEQLQFEEEQVLIAKSEPLRNYLIKFIFPTLAKGLIETARVRPCDPVDFLALYLFKENPEGHMFDPSYTREGTRILSEFSIVAEKCLESLSNNEDQVD